MKRLTAILLSLLLVICGCGLSAADIGAETAQSPTPVTCTGVANGNNDSVKVDVTFDADGKIIGVSITEEAETEFIAKHAYASIPSQIIKHNTVQVDLVSGATRTSNAIVAAVEDAITQAGFDPADYQTEIVKDSEAIVLETDIVIVGAGGSGLAAAVEAAQNGADVLVVESNGYVGGASLFAAGTVFYAATGEEAEREGTIDARTMCDGFKGFATEHFNESLTLAFLQHSETDADWLVDLFGEDVTYTYASGYQPINGMNVGEYKYAMLNPPAGGSSSYYIDTLYNQAAKAGAKVLLNTTAESILSNADGKVSGIYATAQNGDTYTIHAKKVILASGGYGANHEIMMAHTDMTTPVYLGPTSNKGFGITAAEPFNAQIKYSFMPDLEGFGQLVYSTYGGLIVNENAEVLNNSSEIIENLYAVGELTCVQVIDPCHVYGGANLSWNLYSGRIAGSHAAAAIAE